MLTLGIDTTFAVLHTSRQYAKGVTHSTNMFWSFGVKGLWVGSRVEGKELRVQGLGIRV